MATVVYPNITLDTDGIPHLAGTRTKVIEIALDRLAHHWDADEIQRQHPHLSLAQIYSALAYYYDHQAEMDRDIDEQMRAAEQIRASLGESPLRLKLRALGRLP